MLIHDIQKAIELTDNLQTEVADIQEIVLSILDLIEEYQDFLSKAIKELEYVS